MAYVRFETLPVYQFAEKLADQVWKFALHWPTFEQEMLGKPLVQAADNISFNIVSGHGRQTLSEQAQKVRLACIAYNETRHLLRRAYKRKLLTGQDVRMLGPIVRELGVSLNSYLRSVNLPEGHNLRVEGSE